MRSISVQKKQSKTRCILGSAKMINLPKFQTFELYTVLVLIRAFVIFAKPKILLPPIGNKCR
jgi:hypothetical protein